MRRQKILRREDGASPGVSSWSRCLLHPQLSRRDKNVRKHQEFSGKIHGLVWLNTHSITANSLGRLWMLDLFTCLLHPIFSWSQDGAYGSPPPHIQWGRSISQAKEGRHQVRQKRRAIYIKSDTPIDANVELVLRNLNKNAPFVIFGWEYCDAMCLLLTLAVLVLLTVDDGQFQGSWSVSILTFNSATKTAFPRQETFKRNIALWPKEDCRS